MTDKVQIKLCPSCQECYDVTDEAEIVPVTYYKQCVFSSKNPELIRKYLIPKGAWKGG